MSRTSILALTCVLAGALACDSAPANKAPANKTPAAANKAPAAKAPAEPPPSPPPADSAGEQPPEPPPAADSAGDEPSPEATDTMPPDAEAEPEAEAEAEAEAEPAAPGVWKAPAGVDIRSDAAIPPGTPAANAEAFKRLPMAKADGPPVSAIGPSGIHFDSLVVGRGWEKSRCVEEASSFDPNVDDRVNICLRIVHSADLEETLTVEWSKNGAKATRRSTVTAKAMHAYLTRSYLPIKLNYTGDWTATIKTEDGTVLATVPFTVQ